MIFLFLKNLPREIINMKEGIDTTINGQPARSTGRVIARTLGL